MHLGVGKDQRNNLRPFCTRYALRGAFFMDNLQAIMIPCILNINLDYIIYCNLLLAFLLLFYVLNK